ncbi:MAG: SpoIID/LytB domain-containing protein [Candidatus Aminicenantes bacterium]|nr:SpoIID/LytB domain-containing protein [Candidatus Aminicenantes bacterium]
MRRILTDHHKSVFLVFVLLYFFAGRPAEFGEENLFFQGYPMAKPVIRIALGVNIEDILVKSSSGMKIYQVDGAYKLLAEDASQAHIQGQQAKLSEKFLVQVAQFRKKEEAEGAARAIRSQIAQRVAVSQDSEAAGEPAYFVRIGDFLTRGDALAFIKRAASLGFVEAWIVREEVSETENHPHWVQVNGHLINLNADAALYFIPGSSESFLSYKGRTYRGILVLRGSRKGLILINILNMEDYLKGVVPGELPPSFFTEIEAQKAQAVAARTYALKNLGQFNDLGFDLYATPVSQVYLGLSAEQALSTRAVEQTRGLAAVYDGKLINALYMSTCGGATENVEAMFEGGPMPYLKSTPCIQNDEEGWTIKTPTVFPALIVDNADVSASVAALTSLGVLGWEMDAGWWKAPATTVEAWGWMTKAAALLGKKPGRAPSESASLDFPMLAAQLVTAFDWNDRVDNLTVPGEADRALQSVPNLTAKERSALAYFLSAGLASVSERWTDRGRGVSRAQAAYLIHKVLATYKDFYRQGSVHEMRANTLVLHTDGGDKSLEVVPGAVLFRETGGAVSAVSSLDLLAGDIVRWIETDGKIRLLQIVQAPSSAVLDATSPFHRWQVRLTRQELQERVNLFYPVGRLIDLLPLKRGESKRIVELSLVGQESQIKIRGLRIRQVLNLRDNLFVIDREYGPDGSISHFVFSGKGWGHGVGLCQIGAFRMAQKGSSCEDILGKYYRGISLRTMY